MHRPNIRNIVVAAAAAAMLLSFTASAASASSIKPTPSPGPTVTVIGHIDSAPLTGRVAAVSGWSIDKLNSSKSNTVQLLIDGKASVGWVAAGLKNAAVNTRNHVTGNHGFTLKATLSDGKHSLCVQAHAIGRAAVAAIGCATVTVDLPSTQAQMLALAAKIDAAQTVNWLWQTGGTEAAGAGVTTTKSQITIAPGTKTSILASVMLHEYARILQYRAFGNDADVTSAFNALGGNTKATTLLSVEHGADCIAANLGSTYLSYGCPAAMVTFSNSIAAGTTYLKNMAGVISLSGFAGIVTVTGWAFDPAHPAAASSVQVTDNNVPITAMTPADQSSAGTDALYGISGNHGWTITGSLAGGLHNLCLVAYRVTANQPPRQIICVSLYLPSDPSSMPAMHYHS